ncbi:MAG: ribonuclease HII [Flavobacteriales bacterium CG18_big_fil_WC_8_21_14_2_50_32_9]|nr:MAG: ribonuclease HII [Flavobacteriales bacterium CG18_big_fil_WC_8_21_14_2_50_32_9]
MLLSKFQNKLLEAGCDEAGRGCLAGPVFAAAVVLPKNYKNNLLNDSKQLSEKKRNLLRIEIERDALCFAIGIVDNLEIDKINILNASFLAMHRAIKQLSSTPELLLIDGNRFKSYPKIPHECIIKGDGKFMSIAAASILAKTYRDEFVQKMHNEFPDYNWSQNKAYPTKAHRNAIRKFGTTPYHRMSFRLLPQQLELNRVCL